MTRFFSSFKKQPLDYPTPHLAAKQRIYCIGDIHGRYDLLKKIHTLILADAEDYADEITVVYLGDYIDRGSESKQVIDYLLSKPLPQFKSIFLRGNHEQVLLDFIAPYNPPSNQWFNFGGLSTLSSYNVRLKGIPNIADLPAIQEDLRQQLPASHLDFFQASQTYYQQGDYYFVHAGVKPKLKLEKQIATDLLWIREEFLNSTDFHGKMIVYGHSITDKPDIQLNRIGIDTGAYYSNKLTCLVLENTQQRFLVTR